MDRRTMLAGLAGLPLAGIALPRRAAADPFTGYHAEIVALHDSMTGLDDDVACDPFMCRWGEVDRLAMAGRPTTLGGALGAVEYARREFHQFYVEALTGDGEETNPGALLILHLLDGAIAVLRQAAEGKRL